MTMSLALQGMQLCSSLAYGSAHVTGHAVSLRLLRLLSCLHVLMVIHGMVSCDQNLTVAASVVYYTFTVLALIIVHCHRTRLH